MKKILLFPLALAAVALLLSGKPISDCKLKSRRTGKEIPLHGKVRVIDDSSADFYVRIVDSAPQFRVKKVDCCAKECGEWEFVDSFEDFSIQYVEAFPGVR